MKFFASKNHSCNKIWHYFNVFQHSNGICNVLEFQDKYTKNDLTLKINDTYTTLTHYHNSFSPSSNNPKFVSYLNENCDLKKLQIDAVMKIENESRTIIMSRILWSIWEGAEHAEAMKLYLLT